MDNQPSPVRKWFSKSLEWVVKGIGSKAALRVLLIDATLPGALV